MEGMSNTGHLFKLLTAPASGIGSLGLAEAYQKPNPAAAGMAEQQDAEAEEWLAPPSPTTQSGLLYDRAASLFRAYDLLNRGWLSRTQMIAALSEMSVVHGLGERGLNEVLGQDPTQSREARYSMQDFLGMYERIGLYQSKVARGERIKAFSGASQPPANATNSLALRCVFNAYARYAAGVQRQSDRPSTQDASSEVYMTATQFIRLCQDLELLNTGGHDTQAAPLTFSAIDVVFAKFKAPGSTRRLNYSLWLRALASLSDSTGHDLFAIITEHAHRMQPQLVESQATADATRSSQVFGGSKPAPPNIRSKVQSRDRASLPRLRASADHALIPTPQSARAGRLMRTSAAGTIAAMENLSRVEATRDGLPEEPCQAAEAPAQAQPQAELHMPSRPQSQPSGPRSRPGVAYAWADRPGTAVRSQPPEGSAHDPAPPFQDASAPGHSSPVRPRTGSPGRVARLARVSMVDTAGVATELWKFAPGRPEAWDEAPPWMAAFISRLQFLEEREAARCEFDQALQADIILRTQKWEQAERLLGSKTGTLEARLLSVERHSADSDALVGNLAKSVEAVQALADEVHAVRSDTQAALDQLHTRVSESIGGNQAMVAMAVQRVREEAAAEHKEAAAATAAVRDQSIALQQQVDDMQSRLAAQLAEISSKGSLQEQLDALNSELTAVRSSTAVSQQLDALKTQMLTEIAELRGSSQGQDQLDGVVNKSVELQQKLEALEAQLQGDLASIRTDLGTVQKAAQDSNTADLTQSLGPLQATVTQLQTQYTELHQMVSSSDSQLSSLMSQAELTDSQIEDHQAALDALQAEIKTQVARVQAELKDLPELKEVISGLVSADIASHLEQLQVQMDGQAGAVSEVKAALSGLASSKVVDALRDQVHVLASSGNSQKDGDNVSAALLGSLETRLIGQLEGLEKELTAHVSKYEGKAAELSSIGAKNTEQLSSLSGQLNELKSTVTQVASSVTSAGDGSRKETDALRQQLQELESKVSDMHKQGDAAVSGVSSKVEALRQEVAEVKAASQSEASKPVLVPDQSVGKEKMEQTEQALQALSTQVQQLQAELQGVKTASGASTKELEGNFASMRSAVTSLQHTVASLPHTLGRGASASATADGQAGASSDVAAAATKAVEGVAKKVDGLTSQTSALEAAVESLRSQLATSSSQAGLTTAAIDTVNKKVEALVTRATALESGLDGVRSQQSAAAGPGASAVAALNSKVEGLVTQAAALQATVDSVRSADPAARVAAVEGAMATTANKLAELEAGMQALAAAALQHEQHQAGEAGKASSAALDALTVRLAAVESSITELRQMSGSRSPTLTNISDPDHHDAASDSHGDGGKAGGAHASRRDVDAMKVKIQQMNTVLQDLVQQVKLANSNNGGHRVSFNGAPDKPGTPPMGANAVQMQAVQMQLMQQVGLVQQAVAQLSNKVTMLESRPSGQGAAAEAAQQALTSQVGLLQGALVQLNGEVNSMKLAMPQLMSILRADQGDVAVITAKAAAGEFGPVIGALAEEVQRSMVRAQVVDQDLKFNMMSLAKSADVVQLEMMLATRAEKLEEAVEDLKSSLRQVYEGGVDKSGGRGTLNRMQSAAPPGGMAGGGSSNRGGESPGGANAEATHRFATWDALKHAEGMLIKAQQQAKDEVNRMSNTIGDLRDKMSSLEDKTTSRLDLKEKVLMRMAKEVDEMKTTLANLPRGSIPTPSAAPGRGGHEAAAARATTARSHARSMFDD